MLKLINRYFILGLATVLLLISCRQSTPTPDSTPASTEITLKVAMLFPGSHADESWSQSGYEGLKQIESEYNAEIDFTEYVDKDASEAVIRDYAEADVDLIIAHSGSYIAAAETVAEEFPRQKFAVSTTYPGNNKNLGAVAFRSGEVGYLTGVLAAMKTQTKTVAYIVGNDYPVYQEEEALFRRGVEATDPDVKILTSFLKTWTDEEKAKQVANEFLSQGADIFAINADEAGVAALKLVTQKEGVYAIGWTKDQHELAPGKVLTSVLQDIPNLILNAATLMQEGRWEGKLYKFGLKEKIYDFAPFRGTLTSAEEAEFNTVRDRVITGEIDITP
ncbi:MAG: BMP family ABC transporter substrate-binding protein [Spirulina sp. SIO3F2]|nr:BMP family ABC transporter substrate-binding protein [Spirulina sp. SIO3F2]